MGRMLLPMATASKTLMISQRKLEYSITAIFEKLHVSSRISGAALRSLINESAIHAANQHRKEVEPVDLEYGFTKVVSGGEKNNYVRRMQDTEMIAYHEAGHDIIALLLGRDVPKVTIVPTNNGAGGYTLIDTEEKLRTKRELEEELQILLGGAGLVMPGVQILFGGERMKKNEFNECSNY